MSHRSTGRHPPWLRGKRPMSRPLAVLVLLAASALAGCMDTPGATDDEGDTDVTPAAHAVTLLVSGFDAPDAGADHALLLTIGHIALYDDQGAEWVPLLTEPVVTTVRFDDASATTLDTYPVLQGRYTQIELLVDNATVLTPDGTAPATIDEPVCYTRIALDLTQPAPPTQLELLLSGTAALRGEASDWMVRPALIGSLTDHPDDEAMIEDVDCTSA